MPLNVKKFAFLVCICGLFSFPLGLAQAQDPETVYDPIEDTIELALQAIVDVVQQLWDACWAAVGYLLNDVIFDSGVGFATVFLLIILGTSYVLVRRFA